MLFWAPLTFTRQTYTTFFKIYKASDWDDRDVTLKCCKPDLNSQCRHDHIVQCVGTRQHEMEFATHSTSEICHFSKGKWEVHPLGIDLIVKSGCCIPEWASRLSMVSI